MLRAIPNGGLWQVNGVNPQISPAGLGAEGVMGASRRSGGLWLKETLYLAL